MKNALRIIRSTPKAAGFLLAVIYMVGVFGLNMEAGRELFKTLTPVTLLMSFAVLMVFHENYDSRFLVSVTLIYIVGFFVEVAGVSTGLIFGGYEYGPTLGVKLFHTPLIIGLNWVMLIYCLWTTLGSVSWHPLLKSIVGALAMVLYDIILEPVAVLYDMWSWEGGDIPLQNYLAWFAVSLFFFLMLSLFRVKFRNRIAGAVLAIQVGFFLVLNIISYLWPSI